jgi:hypothetical protein
MKLTTRLTQLEIRLRPVDATPRLLVVLEDEKGAW